MNGKKKREFSAIEILLLVLVFGICCTGALLVSVDLCPDEAGRQLLSGWIYRTGTLPTGNEAETILSLWGFSYALRPFLAAIINALFMRAASLLTQSTRILLLASRMCSVLSVTGCCFFCLRLGHRMFQRRSPSILLAVFVCFLPQVMFLGMYQNNDSLSLAAVTMLLYYLAEGYDTRFSLKSCLGLGISISLCLLSYYSVFGWILMGALFCVTAAFRDETLGHKTRFIAGRAALIAAICLVCAGWFFIRGAILHQGDFFGFAAEARSREQMMAQGETVIDYNCPREKGLSIAQFAAYQNNEWFVMTLRSCVGVFGYMDIYMPLPRYGIYYAVFMMSPILFLAVIRSSKPDRKNALLALTMFLSSVITLGLSFYHSYSRDYQPQGRYVITVMLFIGYMLAYGVDRAELAAVVPKGSEKPGKRLHPEIILSGFWALLFVRTWFDTMVKMLL